MSDGIRNHPAPEGRELGKTLAKWRDEAEEEIDDANHGMVVDDLWRVCWLAEFECEGKIEPFVTRRGEPVTRHETERRVAWGRQTYGNYIRE